MSQDNILAALKPFADAWDEYVRDDGPDGKASAEILFRPDSEFIAASNAMRDVEDIRIKQPMSAESRVSVLEDALTNAKIALRMSQARECKTRGVIDALLQDGEISESARRDLIATLAGDAQCGHASAACRMREALEYAGKVANDAAMVIDRLDGCDFYGSSKLALILALNHVTSKAKAALAASGPCPHAGEVERLELTNHEIAGTLTEIVIERNALRGELAEARKLCGEVALSIEANSHYTQDEDLRTVLHDASIRLRATAKGRER